MAAEDVEFLEGSIDEELDKMAADFEAGDPNEYRVKVYRVLEGKGRAAYLFAALSSDFPILDKIRDTYGSGHYEVRLLRKNILNKRWRTEIEAAPKPVEKPIDSNAQVMLGAIEKLGEMVFRMNEALQNRIAQMQAPPALPAPEAIDQTKLMSNMLTAMLQMKQLFGPSNGGNSITQSIEMFSKGVELAKELSGGNGNENIWGVLKDMVGTFGKPIAEAAMRLDKLQGPQVVQPPIMLNKDSPAQSAAAGAVRGNPNMQQMMLKSQLDFLLKQAKKDGDPELYANLILDNVPEQAVRDFIMRPDAMQKLNELNPEVAQYAVWFTELQSALTDILSEGDNQTDAPSGATSDPARNPERPAGDSGDPTGNAGDGE